VNDFTNNINHVADAWSRWMVVSMIETAVLFLVISASWMVVRRHASPQLGFVLFFLVLLKPLVPVSYHLPGSVTNALPVNLWAIHPTDESTGANSQANFASSAASIVPQEFTSFNEAGNDRSLNAESGAIRTGSAPLEVTSTTPKAAVPQTNRDQQPSSRTGPDSALVPYATAQLFLRLSTMSWLMLAWLTGLFVCFFIFVRAHYRFGAMIRRGIDCRGGIQRKCDLSNEADQRFRSLLTKLTNRGILLDHVGVRLSGEVSVPCVAGILRSVIVIPIRLVEDCRDEELEWILLHEIAHIARYDLPIMVVQRIAFWLQFTNPFTWLADRRLSELREYACDDCALAWSGIHPISAGQAFLRVVATASEKPAQFRTALRLASYSPQASRKNRLSRLLNTRPLKERLGRYDWLVIVVIGLLLLPHWRLSNSSVAATESVEVQDAKVAATANQEKPIAMNESHQLVSFELFVVDSQQQQIPNVEVEVRGNEKLPVENIEIGSLQRQSNYGIYIKTDERGHLRLQLSPKHSPSLKILHPGYGPYWIEWNNEPRPASFTAELDPGVSVGGIIVNEAGQPVVGANVRLGVDFKKRPGDAKQLSVGDTLQTNPEGRWQFDYMPADKKTFSVEICHPEYASLVQSLSVVNYTLDKQQEPTESLVMNRGLIVTGKVVDHRGEPIAGALVRTKHLNDVRQAITNDAGGYRLTGCKPELSRIVVSATGKAVDMRIVDVDTDMQPVDFVMQPGGSVRVRVIDQDGNPVPDARIFFQSWRETLYAYFEFGHVNQYADQNGVWEWREAPLDEFKADIVHPRGMGLSSQSLKARDEEYVFQVHPPLILSGRVLDAKTKQPLPKFQVTPGVRSESNRISWADVETFTAVDGFFELRLERDYPAQLVKVHAPGYATLDSREVKSQEGRVELLFELEPSLGMQAQVLTPTGEPAAGAHIALGIPNAQISIQNGEFILGQTYAQQTIADEQGRFQFPGPTTDYQLLIVHPSGFAVSKHHRTNAEDSAATLQLTAWATAEGNYQIAGQPAAGIQLSITSGEVDSLGPGHPRILISHSTVTDQNGRYKFSRVFPGKGWVARDIVRMVGQGATDVASSTCKSTTFVAGESTRIDFEDVGASATGRLLPDKEIDPSVWPFVDIDIRVDRDIDSPPLPLEYNELSDEAKSQWLKEWLATDPGKTWQAAFTEAQSLAEQHPSYRVTVDRDGRFRVEDIVGGNYVLNVQSEGGQTSVHRLRYKFNIPESAAAARQAIDLGEIAVTVESEVGVSTPAIGTSVKIETNSKTPQSEWLDRLQGNWIVEQCYHDELGNLQRERSTAIVVGNRIEFLSADNVHLMIFDLVVVNAGPPQQLDMKLIMSENERTEMLKPFEGSNETPPVALTDPVFHAIIEAVSDGLRICNHQHPCEARPIQFSDKGGRVTWNLTRPR
jgi:beta-lactamase regulating signal transducer with metallopeptidase domain/protocatechuate 3,4-dioxygenase beta subunit